MKRIGLVCLALALGVASTAHAQALTMQMSNGWTFTFSGNVSSFLYYTKSNTDGVVTTPGHLVPAGGAGEGVTNVTRISVGLLPAFVVFDAKGREDNIDVGVHFGFAPSVQCGVGVNDCFGTTIDMRQVYFTVGGSWGQLLVGRELGLFSRQNILTDQTLLGIGGSGAATSPGRFGEQGASTTLGRIGYGYVYPNYRAQITYSTVAGHPYQLSIGVFEAAAIDAFGDTRIPRVEAEFTYAQSGFKGWVGGTVQNTKTASTGPSTSLTAWGGSGGLRYETARFSVTGSGYYGKGIGTTFFGRDGTDGRTTGNDDARKSYGFIGQIAVTPPNSRVTIAGSYGSSYLKAADTEADSRTENTLLSGGLYVQASKAFKVVGEFDYEWSKAKVGGISVGQKNTRYAPAIGFMLFF